MLMCFLVYLAFSIILSSPDSVFHSWERFSFFCLLFSFTTSLLQSACNIHYRTIILDTIFKVCIAISLISFFCYFMNINLFENSYSGEYYTDYNDFIGHFSGVTKHSMVLGPIAGISILYLFNGILKHRNKMYFISLCLCTGTLFFAASRAAIFATFFGILMILFKFVPNGGNKKNIAVFIITSFILFPLYQPFLNSAINKHGDISFGVYDSRTVKVESRIDEFYNSPVYGVGFCAINPDGKDDFNHLTGTIEPGSSWLAVLSMSGIVGFIFFLIIMIQSYRNVFRNQNYKLLGLLSFFTIHMLVEGYIFSAGNVITFILWITIGCCLDLKHCQFIDRERHDENI